MRQKQDSERQIEVTSSLLFAAIQEGHFTHV